MRPALLLQLVAVVSGSALEAQSAQRGTEPDCGTCRIVLTRIGQIDGADDEHGFPRMLQSIVRDARGRFWASFYGDNPPVVYDVTGRIVKQVARIGPGPGEVGRETGPILRGRGDTMLVVDGSTARIHLYTSDGGFVRSRQFVLGGRGGNGVIQLQDGRFVSSGDGYMQGHPLQMHDASGRRLRSFGADEASAAARAPAPYLMIGQAGRGFWAVDRFRYTITVYEDPDGPPVTVPHRTAWFTPSTGPETPDPERSPQSQVVSLAADDRGRMWIVSTVADPKWRSSWGRPRLSSRMFRGGSPLRRQVDRFEDYADTWIEVFDIATKRLLASWKTELTIMSIFPGGVLLAAHGDGMLLSIHRAALAGLPQ